MKIYGRTRQGDSMILLVMRGERRRLLHVESIGHGFDEEDYDGSLSRGG
jgi:hypothetical protein